jgi:hypothetical protein
VIVMAQAEPSSKDALFGVDAPSDPARKDALFGEEAAGAKGGPRITGFVDALAAYTYADPTHWSRGVGRLQVNADGRLSKDVKWKLGARVDADVVYMTSNFYLEPVKTNQRFDAFWGENYLSVAHGDWDFTFGAQQIIWGEVVGLFVADVVSARDTREFLLPRFDLIRIPQWAVRAEYNPGDAHLELVWIPVPAFDEIGKPGADFYPAPLPSPTPPEVAALFRDPVRPARTLANSSYGIRGQVLLSGWDLSAFYYRSFAAQPTFYRVVDPGAAQPLAFEPRHDRIWQAGMTVSKAAGDFVFRGEAVYTNGQNFSVTTLDAPEGVVKRETLDYIVSVEFLPLPELTVNLQAFQRVFFGGGTSDFVVQSDGVGASIFLAYNYRDTLTPQLLWIQSFDDAGGMIRPRLDWRATTNTTVGIGVDIFTGPSNGFFGRYHNRDRAYAEMRYTF